MKEITDHHDGYGLNDLITIVSHDEDENGVPHTFAFSRSLTDAEKAAYPRTKIGLSDDLYPPPDLINLGKLVFQRGPRSVEGSTPGLTTDAVLVALIHHLKGFTRTAMACRETNIMVTKLEEALHWSRARAKDRARRGVLGQNKA